MNDFYSPNEPTEDAFEVPSFHTLALGILSGRWPQAGSAPGLMDTYEVWRYRHEPVATVIVAHFDDGAVLAGAAFAPGDMADSARFRGALEALVAAKTHSKPGGDGPRGQLSDLELLSLPAAFEQIGRALGVQALQNADPIETLLVGSPSENLLDELSYIAEWSEIPTMDPEATLFAEIAQDLLEEGGEVRWTRARERTGAPRIEVLQHHAVSGPTILIEFPGQDSGEGATVSTFMPASLTEEQHRLHLEELDRLIEQRALEGEHPRPLVEGGPFSQIGHGKAAERLREAIEALEVGQGCSHALLTSGKRRQLTKHSISSRKN